MITKKILICTLVMLFFFCMVSCGTDTWISARIPGYGSVKVPQNWKTTIVDGFMYFYIEENGERQNVLVQYNNDKDDNEYFSDIKGFTWLVDEHYSNSAGITKYQVSYSDGSTDELFALDFGGDEFLDTRFLCLDNTIPETTLKIIAKSYQANQGSQSGDG